MSVLTVGAGQNFSTISAAVAAAQSGDTINVLAGTYTNDFPALINNLTIQGVGGIVHLVATAQPSNGKAIFDVAGTTTLKNLDFSGATVPDGNGAGVRYEGGNLVIENTSFENNQDGILGAADPAGTITIDQSEFANNGAGDGRTHNIYIGDIAKFTLTNSYIHNAIVGHEVKSRAETNIITGNRIFDNVANSSYSIDLPNGGNATIAANVIEKGPYAQNGTVIAYGEEGSLHTGTSVSVTDNTIINDRYAATAIWDAPGTAIAASGNNTWNLPAGPGFSALPYRIALDTSSPISTTAPDTTPPAITARESVSGWTNLTSDTLSGTVSDGESGVAEVEVYDVSQSGIVDSGRATLGANGSWSYVATGLADGSHSFLLQAYDNHGNVTGLYAGPADRVDTVGPTLTAGQSVSGTSSSSGIVLSGTVTDAGSGVASVELYDRSGGATIDLGAATLNGATWQFTDGHVAPGAHNFSAVARDLVGNTSTAMTGATETVVAPTSLTPAILRVIGNVNGGVTLLGSSAANSTVTLTDTSAGVTSVLGTTTASASGAFSLTTAGKISPAAVNTFAASATDASGHQGTSTGLFQLSSTASETLSGTAGQSDVFATFLRTGQDMITGFESTLAVGAMHDVINLSGTGYGTYAQVASHISGAGSAVIQLDPTRSVTVLGVSAAMLQASDFRFS